MRTTNIGTPPKRAYRQLKLYFIYACIKGMDVIEAMQAFRVGRGEDLDP